jgi:hypothetical protein
MGSPKTPTDAAPSYEEHFNTHPVNQTPQPSSSNAVSLLSSCQPGHPSNLFFPLCARLCRRLNNVQYIPVSTIDFDHNDEGKQVSQDYYLKSLSEPNHVHCKLCDDQATSLSVKWNMRMGFWILFAILLALFLGGFILGSQHADQLKGNE